MTTVQDSDWVDTVLGAGDRPARCQMYVDGAWVDSASGQTFDVLDPASGRIVATVPRAGAADVEAAVAAAREAFENGAWTRASGRERQRVLLDAAALIRRDRERLARLEAIDAGKLLGGAQWDIDEVAFQFEYYAGWATKISGEIPPTGPDALSLVVREPVGVVGLISPWNFPLLLASQKVAPALAAGCACVLKPAEQTPLSALALAALLEEAGLPAGSLNVLTGFGEEAGAPLAAHPDVDKVSFTGSTAVGKQIMRAGADNLTRLSLELGGKSPNVVFADADFDAMIDGAAKGIFWNQGQVCGATSRLFVERPIYDRTLSALADRASSLVLGHGLDAASTMGPLVSDVQLDRVQGYVALAEEEGAHVAGRGSLPSDPALSGGSFHAPVILADVRNDMRVAQEEIFGPVLCVMPFDDADEVIGRANRTNYGLAASVWTRDIDKAFRVAKSLRAGSMWINDTLQAPSEAMFGGFKQSGFGRELGRFGLDEYLEYKHIFVRLAGGS